MSVAALWPNVFTCRTFPVYRNVHFGRSRSVGHSLPKMSRKRFRVEKVYSSHLELAADAGIDAVAISAHYAEQGEIAADLLKAGKHVFMEKPMAVSVLQGEKMLNAAKEGEARLMVGFMKRFDPGNVLARTTIRQWLGDGTKGRLFYARNHGFQGHWLNGLSQSEPFTHSDEPIKAFDAADLLPTWLPKNESQAISPTCNSMLIT